jgi:hypothetical protein
MKTWSNNAHEQNTVRPEHYLVVRQYLVWNSILPTLEIIQLHTSRPQIAKLFSMTETQTIILPA